MLVSLYSSRVILSALGVEDFGINNVVAGFVMFLAFFKSSLSNASQRYLSIGLGKKDIQATTIYFRQSNTLMLTFCAGVLILAETIGLWFVCNKLVIPEERMTAALWIYQFAIISTICSIIQVTYVADIIAQERMGIYAYLGIFEAITRLLIAFMIEWTVSIDRLILFGLLTAFVSVITLIIHIAYCKSKFKETNLKLTWNKLLLKEMSKFISANLFGCIAWSASLQGVNILLNIFFGPIVNAARGIAMQVNGAVASFANNIMTAMKPQIIKSYASNDIEYMKTLIEKSSKYITMITLLFSLPLIVETEFVLKLWLGQVPEYTVEYIRIVLINLIFLELTTPLWIVANATGKIVRQQFNGRIITLLALPISYTTLLILKDPLIPILIEVSCNIAYWLYCLNDTHRQINLDIRKYFIKSILPCVYIVIVVATGYQLLNLAHIENTILKFFTSCSVILILFVSSSYLSLNQSEKQFVKSQIGKLRKNK